MGRWREIGVSKGGKVGRQHDRSDSEKIRMSMSSSFGLGRHR